MLDREIGDGKQGADFLLNSLCHAVGGDGDNDAKALAAGDGGSHTGKLLWKDDGRGLEQRGLYERNVTPV